MQKKTAIEKLIDQTPHFETDLSIGLTTEQVESRKKDGLVNKIAKTVTKSYGKIIFDNLVNFFNILLFLIAALMIWADIDWTHYAFLVILTINITIGLIQDIRARRMIDKLKVTSYPMVNALRNGKEIRILSNEIVYGDILLLRLGDQIPCDGKIMQGFIEVNESLLTGESKTIQKEVGSSVFSGTYVKSGNCKYRVEAVGKANYAEQLQNRAKQFKKKKSEILKTIDFLFKIIGVTVIVMASALFITAAVKGTLTGDFKETIISISGSLVAMIPTGMYLLTSLTLAIGVIRLARKRMLVQQLYTIESLARVDTICFDKTGTLTDGSLEVKQIEVLDPKYKDKVGSLLNTLVEGTKDYNATTRALTTSFSTELILGIHSAVPFNSDRKYSAVMLDDGRSIVLGAREFVPHEDKHIDELCESFEKQGLRVLLLGSSKTVISPREPLHDISPIAIVVMEDHIRDDARDNIAWFKNNGVTVKIISGDNAQSVSEIAKRVGVTNADSFISLEGMPVEMVKEIANKYTVFGRVSPEQKEVLVQSMQADGHIVAMTGDGVNDILALKAADCSIAMASGSDAAKTISHLVSLDDNFSSLPNVVSEGRRVINNLQRTCSLFLVKTLFAIVMTLFFLVAQWITGDMATYAYPFATINMGVWELVTIGFGSLMLSVQPNNEKLGKHGFLTNILTRSVPAGLTQCLLVVIYFILFKTGIFPDLVTFKAFAIITFTVFSMFVLIRVSLPFDAYRLVLNIGLGIVVIGIFLIDWGLYQNGNGVLKISYSSLTSDNWWILLIVVVLSIPLYIGLEALAVKVFKKVDKKFLGGKKYENF